jgi:hypothetical protein
MIKHTGNSQIDGLNAIVLDVAKHQDHAFYSLSTGEQVYVALASNRMDLLAKIHDYTIAEALARLGPQWIQYLVDSWEYAGNPANYESESLK